MLNAKSSASGLKWVFTSLLIEGLMLSLLIMSNLTQLQNSLLAQTQTRLNESSTLLQSALSAPLVQMDYATAKAIMTETQQLEGIVYLVVLDRQNKPIIHVGWNDPTLPDIEQEPFSPPSLADARFDTRIPLSLEGTPLGTLAIGLSTQFYIEARHDALIRSVVIAFFELLFSALLLLSLNYWFGKKFTQLTQQAIAIANGNYDQRLSPSEHREYDQLVSAFNQMTDTIAHKITQLEQSHHEQQQLNAKILHLVNHDALTQLASRYALDSYLTQAIHHQHPTCLLLCDLDNFKAVNDQYGHQVGDQLLKQFALLMPNIAPEHRLIARLEGNRFAILFNDKDIKRLNAIASSMSLHIMNHNFAISHHIQLQITSSMGYSCFPSLANDAYHLLNQAEMALHHAKQAGKSTYRVYQQDQDI